MNKQIAYKLLANRLRELAEMDFSDISNRLNQDEHVNGDDGVTYTLGFRLEGATLFGQIVDNNVAKFEMLEERIELNKNAT